MPDAARLPMAFQAGLKVARSSRAKGAERNEIMGRIKVRHCPIGAALLRYDRLVVPVEQLYTDAALVLDASTRVAAASGSGAIDLHFMHKHTQSAFPLFLRGPCTPRRKGLPVAEARGAPPMVPRACDAVRA